MASDLFLWQTNRWSNKETEEEYMDLSKRKVYIDCLLSTALLEGVDVVKVVESRLFDLIEDKRVNIKEIAAMLVLEFAEKSTKSRKKRIL